MNILKPLLTLRNTRRIRRFHTLEKGGVQRQQNPYFTKKKKNQIFHEHAAAWMQRDGWALVGIIIMLAGVLWYFGFHQQRFLIRQTNIEGVQFLDAKDIQSIVNEYMSGRTLGIIPHDTYWTFSEGSLQQRIERHYRDTYAIAAVSISKEWPGQITVRITERIPSITWVTRKGKNQQWYTVDREGIVTQALAGANEAHAGFPKVYDMNRERLEVGWHVISPAYITFLLQAQEQFTTTTGIGIDSYIMPAVDCTEKQIVAERVFQQEISESASQEYKNKKRAIQEQFQAGELTVDQSLDALEKIKNEELIAAGEMTEKDTPFTRTEWETVFVPVDCDLVTVATDLYVRTAGDDAGFDVYLDTTKNITGQLQNLLSILQGVIEDRSTISYIDVRILDRAYYK